MFNLIIGISCIAFFGYGAIILFLRKNYRFALGCVAFVVIGIFIIVTTLAPTDAQPEISTAQKTTLPVVETTNEPNKQTTANVTLKNDPKNDVTNTQLLTAIQGIVNADFTFETSIKQIELNENIGTDINGDFIALISLSYDALHSEDTTKKWIDEYTSHLAAKLAEEPIAISSLVVFWETPRFKEDWNTAKISFVKHDDGLFYLESEKYDGSVFKY